jgi:Tol biopolymer transport system component
VATSPRGALLVVYGEPHPWAPATVTQIDAAGQVLQSWELDRGVEPEPRWAPDGLRIVATETDRNGVANVWALHTADGSRKIIGHDAAAAVTAQDTLSARGDRLLRIRGTSVDPVVRHRGRRLRDPLVSPDESRVAYASVGERDMELRVAAVDGSADALLFTWEHADVTWQWAPDGSRLFAVLPGDWDWQVWEIPLDGSAPRGLVREAAAIGGLAVADDGNALAITAAAALDYANERREIFVLDRRSGKAQRYDIGGATAHGVACPVG